LKDDKIDVITTTNVEVRLIRKNDVKSLLMQKEGSAYQKTALQQQ